MIFRIARLSIVLMLVLAGTTIAFTQDDRSRDKDDQPTTLKENLAKMRIKQDEEDFQKLVKKSEEAVKLSEELNKSFVQNKRFSSEDTKKLEKLEKLVKKIRSDLGAEDDKDENPDDKPSTLPNTINGIKEKTTNLLAELKKTGRFAVSVAAVESSNAIIRMVKFLRFTKN